MQKDFKKGFILLILILAGFGLYYIQMKPEAAADWQETLAVPSTAEFNGDLVTVYNVRNFRYIETEEPIPAYYDKTYDLREIKKVWFVTEPFNEMKYAAHTFLSFEFTNGDFLSITIEARKTTEQKYSAFKGFLKTYPLIYIAADERDVILMRANVRKDNVYVYPVKLSKPENARLVLVDMLETMNELMIKPKWYNTMFANCTSSIAKHVNKIDSGRISLLSWQLLLTASADKLAHEAGLLDTDLSIDEAREKYFVTDKSQKIGDVENYSRLIRE